MEGTLEEEEEEESVDVVAALEPHGDPYPIVFDAEAVEEARRNFLLQQRQEGSISDLMSELNLHRQRKNSSSSNSGFDSLSEIEKRRFDDLLPLRRRREREEREADLHDARTSRRREELFVEAVSGRYRDLKLLGRGHNGAVFSAREVGADGRAVALKFLEQQKAGHVGRRLREVAAQGVLPPHNNICQLLSRELHSVGGFEYFVMELCDLSLDDWIEERAKARRALEAEELPPALPAGETLRILYALCDALLTLHRFGVTHRDIKPSNVLLKRRTGDSGPFPYKVKLADFGVADMQIVGRAAAYDTFIGVTVGTSAEDGADRDFRAVVATVYMAWLAEYKWSARGYRNVLLSEEGFRRTFRSLVLEEPDRRVRDLFEAALPRPGKERIQFTDIMRKLEQLGSNLGIVLKQETLKNEAGDVLSLPDQDVDETKLTKMAQFALSAVSGRRFAQDFYSARQYLGWADYLFREYQRQTKRPVSDELLGEFHFQLAMSLFLPETQKAVKEMRAGVENGETVEERLSELSERIQRGVECTLKSYAAKDSPSSQVRRPLPGTNIGSLAALEGQVSPAAR